MLRRIFFYTETWNSNTFKMVRIGLLGRTQPSVPWAASTKTPHVLHRKYKILHSREPEWRAWSTVFEIGCKGCRCLCCRSRATRPRALSQSPGFRFPICNSDSNAPYRITGKSRGRWGFPPSTRLWQTPRKCFSLSSIRSHTPSFIPITLHSLGKKKIVIY